MTAGPAGSCHCLAPMKRHRMPGAAMLMATSCSSGAKRTNYLHVAFDGFE